MDYEAPFKCLDIRDCSRLTPLSQKEDTDQECLVGCNFNALTCKSQTEHDGLTSLGSLIINSQAVARVMATSPELKCIREDFKISETADYNGIGNPNMSLIVDIGILLMDKMNLIVDIKTLAADRKFIREGKIWIQDYCNFYCRYADVKARSFVRYWHILKVVLECCNRYIGWLLLCGFVSKFKRFTKNLPYGLWVCP